MYSYTLVVLVEQFNSIIGLYIV